MPRIVKEKYERYSPEATARRREAARIRTAEWRKNNPEKYKAQWQAWFEKNKERQYKYNEQYRKSNPQKHKDYAYKAALKNVYRITEQDYAELLRIQNNSCAICKKVFLEDRRGIHLDHEHATGRIRGILCRGCNHGLGHFEDDPEKLRAAARYLEERVSILLTT